MKVLLIDADSKIPNLALMKLSSYHKRVGDDVTLVRLNMPYFPGRIKRAYVAPGGFDKKYCSVIFEGNVGLISGGDIIFGGTGFDTETVLPDDVEACSPDYSIYPENEFSYGFLTRGCIRNCEFCKVPMKEGKIRADSSVSEIVKHRKVRFMDNNFFAYDGHYEIMEELANKRVRCEFFQGLDIRLLNKRNAFLLSKINYIGEYIFAFDDWKHCSIIDERLGLLSFAGEWRVKFFVYVNDNMKIKDTIDRVSFIKSNRCLPYIMRDINCWSGENREFWIDIAAYCNQVHIFKKMTFSEFLSRRYKNKDRIDKSNEIWEANS